MGSTSFRIGALRKEIARLRERVDRLDERLGEGQSERSRYLPSNTVEARLAYHDRTLTGMTQYMERFDAAVKKEIQHIRLACESRTTEHSFYNTGLLEPEEKS